MKFLLGAIVVVAVCFASCNNGDNKENQAVSLSKNIEYTVKIYNSMDLGEGGGQWYRENIEASTRLPYLDLLLKSAESGVMKITDTSGNVIDTAKLKSFFFASDTITMTRPMPPYDMYDTVLSARIVTPSNIVALRFREEWSYDPTTLAITKKVVAVAPIKSITTFDAETGMPDINYLLSPYWINFDEKSYPTYMLTQRIMYGVDFKQAVYANVKNIDSTLIEKYFNTILERICSDSLACYEYTGEDLANHRLSGAEVKTLMKEQPETFKNISNIRFLEEWTFDYTNLSLTKRVVGVCPVTVEYDENGEIRGYRPLFWVYFGDVWTPFNKRLKLE